MHQRDLEQEISRVTGETRAMIRRRGFGLLDMPEDAPLTVDWDALEQEHVTLFPCRSARITAV